MVHWPTIVMSFTFYMTRKRNNAFCFVLCLTLVKVNFSEFATTGWTGKFTFAKVTEGIVLLFLVMRTVRSLTVVGLYVSFPALIASTCVHFKNRLWL